MCVFVNSVKEEFDLGRLLILLLMVGFCQQCERGTRSRSIVALDFPGGFLSTVKEELDLGRFLFLIFLVMCVFVSSVKGEFDPGRLLILLLEEALCQQCKRGIRYRSIVAFTVAGDVCFC